MKLPHRHLAAIILAGGLLLTGCSGDPTASDDGQPESTATGEQTPPPVDAAEASGGTCDTTVVADAENGATGDEAASLEALEGVGVSDDPELAPTVTFEAPLAVGVEVTRVVVEGSGDPIAEGDLVTIHYLVCDTTTGEKLYSTWGETPATDSPETYILSPANLGAVLTETLDGAATGSQVLWAQPGLSAEESGSGSAVNGFIYALTVTDSTSVPDSASGTEVTPTDDSLPVVTFVDGKPAVEVPESFTDPSELVVQPLIEGEGEPVEAGQNVMVKYTGWLTDGTQFDSSWDREPPQDVFGFQAGAGNVIQGWDEGVIGTPVGSRVLLVIPSELGYGPTGAGEDIPPDATLVFVVDVLAAS